MNTKQAETLLAAVIIARSTAYLLSQAGLDECGPLTLLGVRFLLSFLVLTPVLFVKRKQLTRRAIAGGAKIGLAFFLCMVSETLALASADSSLVGFLENTAIVLVPILVAIGARKAPQLSDIASSCVALFGVLLLAGGSILSFTLSPGLVFGLLSALFYAIAIVVTSSSVEDEDPLVVGVFNVFFQGLFAMSGALLLETPTFSYSGEWWGGMAYLIIVCTVFGFTLQPLAQKYSSANKAGLFCALNPVCAAVLGVVIGGEFLGIAGYVGGALIVASIVVSKVIETRQQAPQE